MAMFSLLAILLAFFASHVAAQNAAPSNTATAVGSFPFHAATVFGGGFNTATSFLATATPFGSIFGTDTRFGPSPTGPFSSNVVNTAAKNPGKVIGITVGIVLGCYLILFGIVLWVFVTRQKNRKAWYGPTAEFYRNGGRMGDMHGGQPLLSGAAKSFVTTSSSLAPSSTLYPALPYQPSPSPSTQYGSEVNYGYGSPLVQYQLPPTGQFDPNPNYGQPYPQYYDQKTSAPYTGSTNLVIQV